MEARAAVFTIIGFLLVLVSNWVVRVLSPDHALF